MNADADSPDDDGSFFEPIREHEAGVESLATRSDQLGAAARVLLALARDEPPSESDLKAAGFVSGPETEGSSW